MATLFTALKLKETIFRNRIFVSPMCQYSSENGMPTDWHLVHLGSRAVGGAALVMVEATAVSPEGRISPWDSGIWSEEHPRAFARIAAFIKARGSPSGYSARPCRPQGLYRRSLAGRQTPGGKRGWVAPPGPQPLAL